MPGHLLNDFQYRRLRGLRKRLRLVKDFFSRPHGGKSRLWLDAQFSDLKVEENIVLLRHFQFHLRRHLRHGFVAVTGEVHRFNNSATSTAASGKASGATVSPARKMVLLP